MKIPNKTKGKVNSLRKGRRKDRIKGRRKDRIKDRIKGRIKGRIKCSNKIEEMKKGIKTIEIVSIAYILLL